MKRIVFLCAQPDVAYFHWQVEVMIHNFMKVGINPNNIEILFSYDSSPSNEGRELAGKYPYVRFFFYKRTILDNGGYIPILRPDIIEQHFICYPDLSTETIFYHDSDIIFRELPDFNSMNNDDIWYLSDTISYISADYIKSKSDVLFKEMCDISGIDTQLVESNNPNSGGAQYLMKGVDSEYWKEVKEKALALYKYMSNRETDERKTLTPEELKNYNPIQKWCADMWAVLWMSLKRGNKVQISKELNFSWGTSPMSDYESCKIFHNAGVTTSSGGLFYKGEFINKNPFESDLSFVKKDMASFKYVEAILYAKDMRNKSL